MSRPDLLIDSYRSNQRIANSKAGNEEELEIRSLDRIASLLDDFIRIPILNIRIGLDPILGMLPWAGDTLTAIFSLYLIGSAIQYQLPKVVILRMAMNVAFDYLIGLIPFVGDASDFFVKSNRWNMNLFRQYARGRRRPSPSDYLFVIFVIGALIALIVGGIALLLYSLKNLSHWW